MLDFAIVLPGSSLSGIRSMAAWALTARTVVGTSVGTVFRENSSESFLYFGALSLSSAVAWAVGLRT